MRPALAKLHLDDLSSGFPHIPPACGETLSQAAAVSLRQQGHGSGVAFKISGQFKKTWELHWTLSISESMLRYWNDPEATVEQAAYGVAILLMRSLTGIRWLNVPAGELASTGG